MHSHLSHRPAGTPKRFSGGRLLCVVLAGVMLLAGGCASRKQMMQVQEQNNRLELKLDSVRADQQEMFVQLDDLQKEVRDMKVRNESGSSTMEEKIQALASQMDDILARMDRTLAPLEEFMHRQTASDTAKGPVALGTDYYDAAMRDLTQGNYDLAEVGFLQFLENYPKSDLADDARFELGESYYARKRYDEAIEEFGRVIEMAPQGTKTPAAMLKKGLCLQEKNNLRDARKTWDDLVKQFPNSDEAKIAQQRLNEIKGKK
jgi:tol-pal system protein YbgF